MGKGWGYGKNWTIIDENKMLKVFENNEMKVYKAHIMYVGKLTVTFINTKNKKTVILKHASSSGKSYDVTDCRSKKQVAELIRDKLLWNYYCK